MTNPHPLKKNNNPKKRDKVRKHMAKIFSVVFVFNLIFTNADINLIDCVL